MNHKMLYAIEAVVLGVVVVMTAWIGFSYMEASTYNRITGEKLTPWDAMWVGLNIQPRALVRQIVKVEKKEPWLKLSEKEKAMWKEFGVVWVQ